MELIKGIHSYMWRGIFQNNSNMYFFDPLSLLIDPGTKLLFSSQTESLQEDGISLDQIKYVFSTHCHPDHVEAVTEFADRPDVKTGMFADEFDFYKEQHKNLERTIKKEFADIHCNTVLTEGPMEINGHVIEIIHTPGHTPGSMSIYWPEKKALACGDVLFDHSFGKKHLPGIDYEQLCSSLERLMKLDVEYLLPGHAGVVIGKNQSMERMRIALEDDQLFI